MLSLVNTPIEKVTAHAPFEYDLYPEVADFAKQHELTKHVSALHKGLEADGKDVPILFKHYNKLGAGFHCLGIDKSFKDTPGLLLSMDLPTAPEKLLKLYMGDKWRAYRGHG